MQPRRGKCPHCGARLDWNPTARSRAARRGRLVVAVAGVGAAAAVGWTLWGADDPPANRAPEPAPAAKAAACESLTKKLVSGAALSRSEIETFRSVCGKPAPPR